MALRRKLFLGANWKCNNTLAETKDIVNKLYNNIEFDSQKLDVVVAPMFLHIPWVQSNLNNRYKISVQNLSHVDFGAFTGEVSAQHVRDLGLGFTLIGHSERRHLFLEDEELLHQKTKKAIKEKIGLIYCVGEKLADKESKQTTAILQKQLNTLISKYCGVLYFFLYINMREAL